MDCFRFIRVVVACCVLVGCYVLVGCWSQTVVAQEIPVRITLAGGPTFEASLQSVTGDGVEITDSEGKRVLPLTEISKIERAQASDQVPAITSVGLRGGSRLVVDGVNIEGDTATLTPKNQLPLEIPIQQLDWIRFRAPSPAVDADWLGLVGQAQKEDVLVIRRSATAIDQAPGIVIGITAEQVTFELGGSSIPAPVAKLEGIVFANRVPVEARGTTIKDIQGSRWAVETIAAGDSADSLSMILAGGVRRALKLADLQTIQFADEARWLADLAAVESQYTPLVKSSLDPELQKQWLGPRVVDGRDYLLRSRSSITFRVEPEMAKLISLVGIDPAVEAGTGALVRVLVDGETAWEQVTTPGDDIRGLELDIALASRVTLEVDFGNEQNRGDAGDTIRFIGPRFVK